MLIQNLRYFENCTLKSVDNIIFQTCFFLLLIVEHNLKKRGEPWPGIKESLQRFAQTGSDQPPFLANKTAQVLALAFVDLYPAKWPDFFQSLIQSGPDIFLRTLSQIDGEVVNRQINHSKVRQNMRQSAQSIYFI